MKHKYIKHLNNCSDHITNIQYIILQITMWNISHVFTVEGFMFWVYFICQSKESMLSDEVIKKKYNKIHTLTDNFEQLTDGYFHMMAREAVSVVTIWYVCLCVMCDVCVIMYV